MLDLRLREQERFLQDALGTPELTKAGDVLGTSCPERFSRHKGPDGVSSVCSQLITCFCFHLCSPVGDWGLLLSNNVGYCLGGDTWFKQLPRFSQWENEDVVCLLCIYTQVQEIKQAFLWSAFAAEFHHVPWTCSTSLKSVGAANRSQLCKQADSWGCIQCKSNFFHTVLPCAHAASPSEQTSWVKCWVGSD